MNASKMVRVQFRGQTLDVEFDALDDSVFEIDSIYLVIPRAGLFLSQLHDITSLFLDHPLMDELYEVVDAHFKTEAALSYHD